MIALQHHIFTSSQILLWAWRLPFLFAFVLGLCAYFLRKKLPEPNIVREKIVANPILVAFKENKKAILQTICLNMFNAIGFYVFFVFMVTYFAEILHTSMRFAITLNTLCLLILMSVIPLAGFLSDIYTRKKFFLTVTLLLFILIIPAFSMLTANNLVLSCIVMVIITILFGCIQGSLPVTFVGLFPTKTRASGLSISFNISNAIFGGTAPAVALGLIHITGGSYLALTGYLMVSLLIFIITIATLNFPRDISRVTSTTN